MKNLIKLFRENQARLKFDHTEWIETNRGDLRLFAPIDWVTDELGEIEVENEQGEVFSLSELDEDIVNMFIDLLEMNKKEAIKAKLIEEIRSDINTDWTVLDSLLDMLPTSVLKNALNE